MTDNVRYLYEISQYKENWDDEDGLPFDARFIREIIDLVSTMKKCVLYLFPIHL